AGLLKEELHLLGSKLLPVAESCAVSAGHSLAVDRNLFAQKINDEIIHHPNIEFIPEEITTLPTELSILATGPLTSDNLIQKLQSVIGSAHLYFYDAIAPIVSADSLNMVKIYLKNRYDKGEPDYLNCPFTEDEYYHFVEALLTGEKHPPHSFENEMTEAKLKFYENCIPIEELARRGKDTLRFGVMRPIGLEKEGKTPFAVLQLRPENKEHTAYNLVGCQTMLRYSEQKRIFRLIPGLEKAEFLRYGSLHRNSYLNAPAVLNPELNLKNAPHIYVAGQLSGVEGYVECIASGLLVAKIISEGLAMLPPETITGQIWRRLIDTSIKNFQPVNANYGLLPALNNPLRDKKQKKLALSERSIKALKDFLDNK
ncbi:MAG: methylenetetrahydrofolate--tRNA-(uracil(54)-C(5))-methyltransferase (FADH(2)-oxidizing) TrmFO, partial [Candidatus Syntrophosphaera sp.]|nr:methylenetetrahydrofolate--tRNA-(uracil(54)-C(5))-methyltransferase (FADH(2)-oxidizing) TrmFO [Candidatus Syntrophosphaera sp.]